MNKIIHIVKPNTMSADSCQIIDKMSLPRHYEKSIELGSSSLVSHRMWFMNRVEARHDVDWIVSNFFFSPIGVNDH